MPKQSPFIMRVAGCEPRQDCVRHQGRRPLVSPPMFGPCCVCPALGSGLGCLLAALRCSSRPPRGEGHFSGSITCCMSSTSPRLSSRDLAPSMRPLQALSTTDNTQGPMVDCRCCAISAGSTRAAVTSRRSSSLQASLVSGGCTYDWAVTGHMMQQCERGSLVREGERLRWFVWRLDGNASPPAKRVKRAGCVRTMPSPRMFLLQQHPAGATLGVPWPSVLP